MKQQTDKRMKEREFEIRDQVLLKLQPYRQDSIKKHPHQKLSARYYRPYNVIDRVGKVAYKPDLPLEANIYSTFHVSRLKRFHGEWPKSLPSLPTIEEQERLEPAAVLERKITKRGNATETLVLILWKGKPISEATWESLVNMKLRSPNDSLWTSECLEGGNVMGATQQLGFLGMMKNDKTKPGVEVDVS